MYKFDNFKILRYVNNIAIDWPLGFLIEHYKEIKHIGNYKFCYDFDFYSYKSTYIKQKNSIKQNNINQNRCSPIEMCPLPLSSQIYTPLLK